MRIVFKKRTTFVLTKHTMWTLLLIILLIPSFGNTYVSSVLGFGKIMSVYGKISFFLSVILVVVIKRKLSAVAVLLCICRIYLVFITCCLGGDIKNCISQSISLLTIVFIYDLASSEDIDSLISALLFLFEIVIYINLITIILYPGGLYNGTIVGDPITGNKNWFLGYYNRQSQFFIPALMVAWVYKYKKNKNIRAYLLLIAIIISTLIMKTGGVIMSIFCMMIGYICFKNKESVFNILTCYMLQVVFFVLIIILKLPNAFRWLLDNVLGKWQSLQMRMSLWDVYLNKLIIERFIFGHGIFESNKIISRTGFYWGTYAHNMILEILFQGGVTYLALFIALIVLIALKLKNNSDKECNLIITCAFLGWSVQSFVEAYMTPLLMGMFVIAYNCDKICKKNND